jgi:hypothetical protein
MPVKENNNAREFHLGVLKLLLLSTAAATCCHHTAAAGGPLLGWRHVWKGALVLP